MGSLDLAAHRHWRCVLAAGQLSPSARAALLDALNGPGAQENPFVHYRLGQAAQRTGRDDEAREHLLRAYMLDGPDIFQAEADGARWLQWLRDAGLVD